jgi:hypothetical protein
LVGAAALLLPLSSQAQWRVGGGVEYFTWSEDTTPTVQEHGPMLALNLGYVQPKDKGFVFGYAGKFYFGDVDYEGATLFPPIIPLSGTTRYTGTAQEVQGRYRLPPKRGYWLDFMGAVGFDIWKRELNSQQQEDYRIGFLRLGLEMDSSYDRGWVVGAGVKYPFYTWEDAHFTNIGFDQNPKLTPGKDVTIYAQAGYRFLPNWQLVGYLDSFRFSESNVVQLTAGGVPQGGFLQPASALYTWGLKVEYVFR